MNLIGKKVYFKSTSHYAGMWGIVSSFDGDLYSINILGDQDTSPVFARSEFTVPKKVS